MEVITKFDANSQNKLNKYFLKRLYILYGVMTAVFIGAGAALIFLGKDIYDNVLGTFLLAAGVLQPLIGYVTYKITVNKGIKANKMLEQAIINRFVLEGPELLVESKRGEEIVGMSRIRLRDFYKAAETSTDFLLFVNKASALIVPKADFVSGTPEQFRTALTQCMGSKFKSKIN